MKKHSMLKMIFLTLFVVVLASWFLPVTSISGNEFVEADAGKVGIFGIVTNISIAIQYFVPIALYVLAVGGLYGVLHKIPQYRVLLDKIANGFEGREWLFMVIVGITFAVLSAMAGLSLPLLLLFPFVISVMLLMGYDKITAAMLTVGSVIAGLIGSVYSVNDVYGISSITSVGADSQVVFKIALMICSLAIVLINTCLYGTKHRGKSDKEVLEYVPENRAVSNKRIYPIVFFLDLLLFVLAFAFISWDLFKVTLFSEMTESLTTSSNFVLSGLSTILGISSDRVFGTWTLLDASLLVVLTSGLIALSYKKSLNEYFDSFAAGAKKALLPAVLVILSYTVLVTAMNVPFELSILRYIIDLDAGFQLIIMCIVAVVFTIFTVESYYGVTSAAAYVGTALATGNAAAVALTWQSMYGITMLFAPTSIVLLSTLSYLDIPYGKWLKAIWRMLLELFTVVLLLLFIFNR